MLKGYLTTDEAAERMGISSSRIRQMIRAEQIKGVQKIGQISMIPEKEITRLKNTERKPGRPAKEKK